MTVVMFTSIKGAPGVTTLACLVGATWPHYRRVAVVESDPFGGDLAARFGLSAKRGWPTFSAASRRAGSDIEIGPHLQQLPGGLDVLVEAGALLAPMSGPSVADLVDCSASPYGDDHPWDLLVDAGRLLVDRTRTGEWMDTSDRVIVVLRCDAPSVVKIAERSVALRARCGERVGLVVVGAGAYDDNAIEGFTGIPVIGRVPFDPVTASVAAGEAAGSYRLTRSRLVASARSLALTLGGPDGDPEDREASGPSDHGASPAPTRGRLSESAPMPSAIPSSAVREPAGRPGWAARRLRDLRHRPGTAPTPAEAPPVGPSPGEADHWVESSHQQVTK